MAISNPGTGPGSPTRSRSARRCTRADHPDPGADRRRRRQHSAGRPARPAITPFRDRRYRPVDDDDARASVGAGREVRLAHANLYTGLTAAEFADDLAACGRRPARRRHPERDLHPQPRRAEPARLRRLARRVTPRRPGDPRAVAHRHLAADRPRHRTPARPAGDVGNPLPQLGHPPADDGSRRLGHLRRTPHPAAPAATGSSRCSSTASPPSSPRSRAGGPVLVGADLNTHYPDADWLTGRLDTLGREHHLRRPRGTDGGWATGRQRRHHRLPPRRRRHPVEHATRTSPTPTTGSSPPPSPSDRPAARRSPEAPACLVAPVPGYPRCAPPPAAPPKPA